MRLSPFAPPTNLAGCPSLLLGPSIIASALLASALVALAAVAAEAADSSIPSGRVVPVDGEPFEARLVARDTTGAWIFESDAGRRVVAADDLVRWGRPVEPSRGPIAVLIDGGILPAEPVRIEGGHAVLESDSLGNVRVPLESLAGLIFAWPAGRVEQDRFVERLLQANGSSDRVLLANGDWLTGVVAAFDGRSLRVDNDGESNDLPRDRLGAVVFNPALRSPPPATDARTWIGLDDGSRFLVERLAMEDGSPRIKPLAASVADWRAEASRCVFIQPLTGRAAYLSDRADDGYRHVPFLDLAWPHRADRNVLGGILRAGGDPHLKGLGMHSLSRLTYLLNEPVERFEAELALDDRAEGGGSVRYYVFVDRQRRLSSDPVRGGDRPVPIRVDLTGAKRLDLVVDFGERADQLDYANWLDARLIRPKKTPGGSEEPPGDDGRP
ncbi:MAG: hypothetical protein GX621_14340 [Pirellulaceae bacterium]|nr:hypothetical protein [Pirellulaceae bacterium]